jgi:long-chain-fatty-acid--CoA ligase ACSBG
MQIGRNTEKEFFWERVRQQTPNSCCTVVYTSGTTGPPKGVMLSHDNYMWVSRITVELAGINGDDDHIVSFLPLSHVAA